MKLFLVSIATILSTLCDAQADPESSRTLRRPPHKPSEGAGGGDGGGGGEFKPSGDRLQAMFDKKCPSFACNGETADTLDCTFEELESEPPDFDGMDREKIVELKEIFNAKKAECKDQMMKSACCAEMSAKDILAAKTEQGGGFRPFGGGESGGRPSGKRQRPGGGGGGGFKPLGERLQAMVDSKCRSYDCKGETADTLDCTFENSVDDSQDARGGDRKRSRREKWKGKWKDQAMKCACCAEMSIEEVIAASYGRSSGRTFGPLNKNTKSHRADPDPSVAELDCSAEAVAGPAGLADSAEDPVPREAAPVASAEAPTVLSGEWTSSSCWLGSVNTSRTSAMPEASAADQRLNGLRSDDVRQHQEALQRLSLLRVLRRRSR